MSMTFDEFVEREHIRRVAHLVRFLKQEDTSGAPSMLALTQEVFGFCAEHAKPIAADAIKVLALERLGAHWPSKPRSEAPEGQPVYDKDGECIGYLMPAEDGYESKTHETYLKWHAAGKPVPDHWLKKNGLA